jgi:hypothetical protein
VTEATEQLSPVTAVWMPAFATRTKHAALSAGTESVASTEIVGSGLSTTAKVCVAVAVRDEASVTVKVIGVEH